MRLAAAAAACLLLLFPSLSFVSSIGDSAFILLFINGNQQGLEMNIFGLETMSCMISAPVSVHSSEPYSDGNNKSWASNFTLVDEVPLATFSNYQAKPGVVLSIQDVDIGENPTLSSYTRTIAQFEDIIKNSLLDHYPPTGGVNSIYWYYKQKLAPFFAHLDIFTSINMLVEGKQQWYGVAHPHFIKVNKLATAYKGDPKVRNSFFPSLSVLDENEIPVYGGIQEDGDLVVIPTNCMHFGYPLVCLVEVYTFYARTSVC